MAKQAADATLDSLFDYIDQSTAMVVCSAEPANFAGVAAVTLATASMTPDSDYTKADAAGGGRQITVAAKAAVPITNSGTATHIALVRATDSTLRYVTTCASQALAAGNTVNIPTWTISIGDPT